MNRIMNRWMSGPGAAVALTLAAFALTSGCAKKEEESETQAVVQVQVAEVRQAPIQREISADGILRPVDQSAIVPKISAPVNRFFVNRGDHVTKGQLLAELESRDLAAAVDDAKGTLEQTLAGARNVSGGSVPENIVKAQQDVQAAKQSMDAALKVLDSRRELQKQGALAQRQVDEAGVAYAQAQSQYETARQHLQSVQGVSRIEDVKGAEAQVASARGKLEVAQAQLAYSQIRSPISGVVADRNVFPGEMANAGMPLLTVMDVSNVIARANVPLSQAGLVRVGQRAVIQGVDSGVQSEGTVTVVSPAVDPNSTTVEVWVRAANPGEKLRPGATVHVVIRADVIPNALVVPISALLPATGGGAALMVIDADSTAHERKIETGVRSADMVEIVKGVAKGDRVVIEGGVGLADGAKVEIDRGEKAEKGEKPAADADEKKTPGKTKGKDADHE
jgi:multidrug efflux pump subunit AcrA (membrane-fusion protein)